jgi:biopolymer transport protein ExbD
MEERWAAAARVTVAPWVAVALVVMVVWMVVTRVASREGGRAVTDAFVGRMTETMATELEATGSTVPSDRAAPRSCDIRGG